MDAFPEELIKVKRLARREREVLYLRSKGLTFKEIAIKLEISQDTVKEYAERIYYKLGLSDVDRSQRAVELPKYYNAIQLYESTSKSALLISVSTDVGMIAGPVEAKSEDDANSVGSALEDENLDDGESVESALISDDGAMFRSSLEEHRTLAIVQEDEIALLEKKLQARAIMQSLEPQSPDHPRKQLRFLRSLVLLVTIAVIGGLVGSGLTLLVAPQPSPSESVSYVTPISPVVLSKPAPTGTAMITKSFEVATRAPLSSTLCGEIERVTVPIPPLLRPQGVTAFSTENTGGAVLNDWARALAIDKRGVWTGYFSTNRNSGNGVGLFNRTNWANCNFSGQGSDKNVNAIAIDPTDRVWVGTEEGGIRVWDGQHWQSYTTHNGLPSDKIFSLTIDQQGNIWAGTWEGIAKFDGQRWTTPYALQTQTIFSNHVHAVAFDGAGNIWVGHIDKGVSQYRRSDGRWIYHSLENSSGIGGNQIRGIVVRPAANDNAETIWFATADGGVSRFAQGTWTTYHVGDGLPSDSVNTIAMDKYKRIWAATTKGVAYFDGSKWNIYNTLHTLAIAFGPDCQNCPYNDDHVWTGTTENGVTHSRLPYPEDAVDVVGIRFFRPDGTEINSPAVLRPGERFRPEITVRPRSPYQLRQDRGDFLSHTDADESLRFGGYVQMAVKGTIEPGQPFVFTDFDNYFIAPQLTSGEQEHTFISTWRVWMFTRYTGPPIHISFTVRRL